MKDQIKQNGHCQYSQKMTFSSHLLDFFELSQAKLFEPGLQVLEPENISFAI